MSAIRLHSKSVLRLLNNRHSIFLRHCRNQPAAVIVSTQYKINYSTTGLNRIQDLASPMSEESDPRKLTEEEWLKKLSPEQYYVCREKGTEEPFTGKYYMHKEEGIYTCICCGTELFSSKRKYDSGTGWPSFTECIGSTNGSGDETHSNVLQRSDNSTGTLRTEVICKKCDGHLGHVFADGPQPTGLRYCINSAALKFVPKKLS